MWYYGFTNKENTLAVTKANHSERLGRKVIGLKSHINATMVATLLIARFPLFSVWRVFLYNKGGTYNGS